MAAVDFGTGVVPGDDAVFRDERSGLASLPAGKWVYRHTDQRVYLASNQTLAAAEAVGLTVSTATAIGQPIVVQWGGKVTNTADLPPVPLVLSDTPGSACPAADLLTTDWMTNLGIPDGENAFKINIFPGRVQHV